MSELDSRLHVVRREDDAPLLTPWKVLDQTAGFPLRSRPIDLYINIVGIVEH
jgi:hypothetical protein